MVNEFFVNHGWAVFLGIFVVFLLLIVSSRKKPRKGKADPISIFGPIHGMYVCYQCDTIFNTAKCPVCNEEAVIPLIHLTGSVLENERVEKVVSRLRERSTWKMPTLQDGQTVVLEHASGQDFSNGGTSQIPAALSARRKSGVKPQLRS